jgi:hypothetical protein
MSDDELAPPPVVEIDAEGTSVDFSSGKTDGLCAWLRAERFGDFCDKMIEFKVNCEMFYYSTTKERREWGCEEQELGGTSMARMLKRRLRDVREYAFRQVEFARVNQEREDQAAATAAREEAASTAAALAADGEGAGVGRADQEIAREARARAAEEEAAAGARGDAAEVTRGMRPGVSTDASRR